jgi:hypothetical protein
LQAIFQYMGVRPLVCANSFTSLQNDVHTLFEYDAPSCT